MDPKVVAELQNAFVSKLGKFVADKDAEFKSLHLAMGQAGYLKDN